MIGRVYPGARGLCAVLAITAVAGCAGLTGIETPPRVNLVDLRLAGMTIFEQRYLVTLRVRNPNDAPLSVRGMDYAIDINGQRFADGVSAEQFTVPAFGESVIDVPVTSSLIRLVEQLRELDQQGRLALNYRLSGSLSVADPATRYPFSQQDTLDLSPAPARGNAL